MRTIYVGNLPFDTTEERLRELFLKYGEVVKVSLVADRETGQSRGFGFVEMPREIAREAIDALDGLEYEGRTLRVNEARDRGARPPRREW